MITGRSITDALKASFPSEPKSKDFYRRQLEIWEKAVEQGLDKQHGMDLSHLINHYKTKAQ